MHTLTRTVCLVYRVSRIFYITQIYHKVQFVLILIFEMRKRKKNETRTKFYLLAMIACRHPAWHGYVWKSAPSLLPIQMWYADTPAIQRMLSFTYDPHTRSFFVEYVKETNIIRILCDFIAKRAPDFRKTLLQFHHPKLRDVAFCCCVYLNGGRFVLLLLGLLFTVWHFLYYHFHTIYVCCCSYFFFVLGLWENRPILYRYCLFLSMVFGVCLVFAHLNL